MLRLVLATILLFISSAALAQQVIDCGSVDGFHNYCAVDARNGVWLQRQHSRAPCVENSTWAHDARGIWVSGGCRATFIVASPSMSRSAKRNAVAGLAGAILIGVLIRQHSQASAAPKESEPERRTVPNTDAGPSSNAALPHAVGPRPD